MMKSHVVSSFFRGTKAKSLAYCLMSKRWTTRAAVEFDDTELASAKPFEELPSFMSLPILGTTWVFLPLIGRYDIKRMNQAMLDKQKILGDIYRERFGRNDAVFSFNPDDLQTMYKHEGAYPVRSPLESLKAYRELRKEWYKSVGVVLLNGKEWHDIRRKTQKHLMKPKAIQAFLDPMQDVARDLVHKIYKVRDSNKEVPDFLGELYKWSLESISLVGLDTRLGCLEVNLPPDSEGMKMINCVQTAFECIFRLEAFSGRIQLWKLFPTPTWKKYVQANDTFTEISFKHIKRSMEELKSKKDEDIDLTLLQSLIMEKGMDISDAMVMVSDMMMAGIDTTSHTIGFFLYQIAKNPDKQEKLYEDIKRILPRKEDKINQSTFNELRFLKACIKESQRLNPIVSVHVRVSDHDVIFSGYRIPAGTHLFAGAEGIFKDERYFSRPNEFLPERWLNKDEKFHPFAFLPFGYGVRSCIGRRLAELEIICLATEAAAIYLVALSIVIIEALPSNYDERSSSIQEQAQDDYRHHQEVLSNQNQGSTTMKGGYNKDGSFGVTFDNKDKNYRDRGYGYEKAYAYSRETAFFDYLDNKPSINAKDLVEKYGNSEDQKNDDLLGSFSY